MMKGILFDIQKFSIHDGPGIRTAIFLKGCSLHCFWCHNPESIHPSPQVMFFPDKCIGCRQCVQACPNQAHSDENGSRIFQRPLCISCGKCAEVCPSGALILSGKEMTSAEVLEEIEQDLLFYRTSSGGATFTGGEPLLQADFLREVLQGCKERKIHTAIETAGNVPWEAYEKVLPYTDLFLHDIKVMDSAKHREATGAHNMLCLENIRRLAAAGADIRIRVPVISGFNDTPEDMTAVRDFTDSLSVRPPVELLPFHRMGLTKYQGLGQTYPAEKLDIPLEEKIQALRNIFNP